MASVINTNVPSLTAQRNLGVSQNSLSTSLQRLSSGLRINSAKDDAAGLAISERFTSQIRGMDQAKRNANDGVSIAQTGEGALSQMGDLLQRVRELAVQSANATNSASDRAAINDEVNQLVSELDRFSTTTEFNGQKLFDGTFGSAVYQVGANANQTITATTSNFRTTQYGTYQTGQTTVSANEVNGGYATRGTAVSGSAVATAGALTVNGPQGSKDTAALTTSSSAADIAGKINAVGGGTGVQASAKTEFEIKFSANGKYKLDLFKSGDSITAGTTNPTLNSISFNLTSFNSADGLSQAVNAFNDYSSKTGVTAKLNGDGTGIILTSADGANVNLGVATANDTAADIDIRSINGTTGATTSIGTLDSATVNASTVAGAVTLNSSKSFSVVGAAAVLNAGVLDNAATTAGTSNVSVLKDVQSLDVTTVDKATQALRIVDGAIDAVNSQRAKFGALQSRFEATVSNLQTASENMSASRSRIRDTDFAAETANMTKAQILQQAGTAMLSQANQLPQQVLSLLK